MVWRVKSEGQTFFLYNIFIRFFMWKHFWEWQSFKRLFQNVGFRDVWRYCM